MKTRRQFYPSIDTQLYDVPDIQTEMSLWLTGDIDLLEVITLTNGDNTVIEIGRAHV